MTGIELQKIVKDVNLEIEFLDFQLYQQMRLVKRLRARRSLLIKKKKIYEKKLEEAKEYDSDFITYYPHDDDLPF